MTLLLLLILVYVACQNQQPELLEDTESVITLKGEEIYRSKLLHISKECRSRSDDYPPSEEDIKELVESSRVFLQCNNITEKDLDIEDETMLPIIAMALLDYNKMMNPTTRTTVGGCVLQAIGISELTEKLGVAAAKQIAKATAKVVLKRAIPYVGWGLFAWEFIDCVTE